MNCAKIHQVACDEQDMNKTPIKKLKKVLDKNESFW